MAGQMLVLAPAAIFAVALALALDVPQRLRNISSRLRSRAPEAVRG